MCKHVLKLLLLVPLRCPYGFVVGVCWYLCFAILRNTKRNNTILGSLKKDYILPFGSLLTVARINMNFQREPPQVSKVVVHESPPLPKGPRPIQIHG